ncbi:MAG: hypothetical protein WBM87_06195 [Woeseiaceae bacterium]
MNKMIVTTLLAGALLLLDAPEAAAHKQVRNHAQTWGHYAVEHRRTQQMPRWLKRNKSFRHWYTHSSVRRDRRLGWHQLFDIYRWERSYKRRYRVDYNYRPDRDYRDYFDGRERDSLKSRRRKH